MTMTVMKGKPNSRKGCSRSLAWYHNETTFWLCRLRWKENPIDTSRAFGNPCRAAKICDEWIAWRGAMSSEDKDKRGRI